MLDFIFLVVPGILSVTLASSHVDSLFLTLLLMAMLIIVVHQVMDSVAKPENISLKSILAIKLEGRRPFLTNFRAFTYLATAVFILAVDFSVYPRRFCKTETYGTGLMDVGVGGFIMANALVAPEARRHFQRQRQAIVYV